MKSSVAWILLGVGLGLALGYGLAGGSAEPVGDAPRLAAPLEKAAAPEWVLREELRTERERVRALEEEVALLRSQAFEGPPPPPAPTSAAVRDASEESDAKSPERGAGDDWFDRSALSGLDYSEDRIERIAEVWGDAVMLRLELADARARAGERGWGPVVRDRAIVQQQAREELGDEDYDAMLYATGLDNRVVIADLVPASPAADAGAMPGDVVLSYADERIFYTGELQRATGAGERGRTVELRVLRGGEEVRLFVPRGPLGVQLKPTSQTPAR